jgi:DNA-binding MarR family transcriptional regulator
MGIDIKTTGNDKPSYQERTDNIVVVRSKKQNLRMPQLKAEMSPETINADIVSDLALSLISMRNDPSFDAGIQLFFCGILLNRFMDLRSKRFGVNRSNMDVMYTLVTHKGRLKPTEIGRMLFRSKQNITGIIDNLEKDGLVERELTGRDRRTRTVIITGKGLDIVRASLPVAQDIIKCGIPSLSEQEALTLRSILSTIRKHLAEQIKQHQQ